MRERQIKVKQSQGLHGTAQKNYSTGCPCQAFVGPPKDHVVFNRCFSTIDSRSQQPLNPIDPQLCLGNGDIQLVLNMYSDSVRAESVSVVSKWRHDVTGKFRLFAAHERGEIERQLQEKIRPPMKNSKSGNRFLELSFLGVYFLATPMGMAFLLSETDCGSQSSPWYLNDSLTLAR